jgi:hypothetical protein
LHPPTILATYADGDTVITQWRMTGTHQKPLMNIQPTGKQCTVDGISIGRFRSGKLVEERRPHGTDEPRARQLIAGEGPCARDPPACAGCRARERVRPC